MLNSPRFVARICLLVTALSVAPVSATPIFLNGTGSIVNGVAPYGGAPVLSPTYIANNFNGLTDILTSPGGGYLTANPVIGNNIWESGINGLPMFFGAAGGSNGNGNFGSANTFVTGPTIAGNLDDANPDGIGAVSYTIASWTSTWIEPVGYNGLLGAYIGAAGTFGSAVSAGALSLRVRVQSASVGNLDLGQLVLAPRANGPCFGINGVVLCNGNSFVGFASTISPVNFVQNEILTVYATLTAIADPMFFETIDPTLVPELAPYFSEFPLSSFNVVSSTAAAVPEPATWLLTACGIGLVVLVRRRR